MRYKICLIISFCLIFSHNFNLYGEQYFKVARVIDGDILEIEKIGKVRLIGVDTPEILHPTKPVQFLAKKGQKTRIFVTQSLHGR